MQKNEASSKASVSTSQPMKHTIRAHLLSELVLSMMRLNRLPNCMPLSFTFSSDRYKRVSDRLGPLPRPARVTNASIPQPATKTPVILEPHFCILSSFFATSRATRFCTGTSNCFSVGASKLSAVTFCGCSSALSQIESPYLRSPRCS